MTDTDTQTAALLKEADAGIEAFCSDLWERHLDTRGDPIPEVVAAAANELALFNLHHLSIASVIAEVAEDLVSHGELRRAVLSGRRGAGSRKAAKTSEDAWVAPPVTPPPPAEKDEWELSFVLLEESSKHVYPNHPFRVLDAGGKEVASGRTDEAGKATVSVPAYADYTVEAGEESVHTVKGRAYCRGDHQPVKNVALTFETAGGERLEVETDDDGAFALSDVPYGELILMHGDAEHLIFVGGDVDGYVCYLTVDEPEDSAYTFDQIGDWHDYVPADATDADAEDEVASGGAREASASA